jgi:AraC-like DNA-binding protein
VVRSAIEKGIREAGEDPDLLYEVDPMERIWIARQDGDSGGHAQLELLDRIAADVAACGHRVEIRFTQAFPDMSTAWWEFVKLQRLPGSAGDGSAQAVAMAWADPVMDRRQYGAFLESLLLSMSRTQDGRMLRRLFEVMDREYFVGDEMPGEARAALLSGLRATAERLGGTPVAALPTDATPEAQRREFGLLFAAVQDALRSDAAAPPRTGSFLHRRILEFIDRNLYDPDLCLKRIADHLKVSEDYLSRVFKEHEGETPSDHIERRRLERSARLLRESALGVGEIAVKVGYLSDTAFRRAFKRLYRMSPNDFRNSQP